MSDSFELTLHDPLTKDDWNKISDAEHENTMSVTFQTPQGRQVKYIKCEVLDKIRGEIEEQKKERCFDDDDMFVYRTGLDDAIYIIDKYRAESEGK